MKTLNRLLALTTLAVVTSVGLHAQTTAPTTPTTPTTPPAPPVIPVQPPGSPKMGKGPNENASANAKAVHAVIQQFREQRDQYLTERKAMLEKLKTATAEEKKAIMEQLREDKTAREADERSLGKQIREELKTLRGDRKAPTN
jgi:acyl-CoA reductase-like NAD-dependent aldehyde dehydrogenase